MQKEGKKWKKKQRKDLEIALMMLIKLMLIRLKTANASNQLFLNLFINSFPYLESLDFSQSVYTFSF